MLDLTRPLAPPTPFDVDLGAERGAWRMAEAARAWIWDGPDGPFMLTAEAYENSGVNLEIALDFVRPIIDTLEFVR